MAKVSIVILCLFSCVLAWSARVCAENTDATFASATEVASALITQINDQQLSADYLAGMLIKLSSDLGLGLSSEIVKKSAEYPGLKDALRQQIPKEATYLLTQSSRERVKGLEVLSRAFFDSADPLVTELNSLISVAQQSDNMVSAGDEDSLMLFLEAAVSDGQRSIVELRIKKLMHQLADQALSLGNPNLAIRKLLNISLSRRDSETRLLAEKALESALRSAAVDSGDADVLDELSTRELDDFRKLLRETGAVAVSSLQSLLQKRVIRHLKRGEVKDAEEEFQWLLQYKPDPDPENNELRMLSVEAAQTPDAKDFARIRIRELERMGPVSWGYRSRLVFSGWYYSTLIHRLVLANVIIIVVLVLLFVFWRRLGNAANKISRNMARTMHPELFVDDDYGDDEYSSLLAIFGLDDSANPRDIRSKYRELMLEHHPNNQAGDPPSDEVVELRLAYERIQEIHQGWFGKDEDKM